jgi:hypothetical protein
LQALSFSFSSVLRSAELVDFCAYPTLAGKNLGSSSNNVPHIFKTKFNNYFGFIKFPGFAQIIVKKLFKEIATGLK